MPSIEALDSEIINYIKYPNEERHLEFKGNVRWDGDIRAKITKSIMAFANLKDGGWIVIGKEGKMMELLKCMQRGCLILKGD